MHTVFLKLDTVPYQTKPNGQFGQITNRLAGLPFGGISIGEAAAKIGEQGYSFTPARFSGNKIQSCDWVEQHLVGLDFDNSLSFSEFKKRCNELSITPAFSYRTLSDQPGIEKFRAVFVLDQMIANPEVYDWIWKTFYHVFPEMDSNCKNRNRIWLGGKGLLWFNCNATVNPVSLYENVIYWMKVSDSNGNFSRSVKKFQHTLGLDSPKDIPNFHGVICAKENDESLNRMDNGSKLTNSSHDLYILYRTCDKNVKTEPLLIRRNKIYRLLLTSSTSKCTVALNKAAFYTEGRSKLKNRPVLTDADQEALIANCMVAQQYFKGGFYNYPNYDQRLLLASSLNQFRNGLAWYSKSAKKESDERLLYSAKKYDFQPIGCKGRCVHYGNGCPCPGKNMLSLLPAKERQVKTIAPGTPGNTVEQTRQELDAALDRVLESEEKKVFIIKVDTGVGKTHAMLQRSLEGVCLAVPTHKLKLEAYDRLPEGQKAKTMLWPDRPALPNALERRLERQELLRVGSVMALYKVALEQKEVLADENWHFEILEFLKAMKDVHTANQVICTHDKALMLRNEKVHTIVFDEDPLKKLFRVTDVRVADVSLLYARLRQTTDAREAAISRPDEKEYESQDDGVMAEYLLDFLQLRDGEVLDTVATGYSRKRLTDLLNELSGSVDSPVGALFTGSCVMKDGAVFRVVERERLRDDKKYVVLSATANEQIWRSLYGNKVEFIDLSGTCLKGRLVQHPRNSFSKSRVRKDRGKALETIKELCEKYEVEQVVSHKELAGSDGTLEGTGYEVFGHFGALEGLDSFSKKTLAIFGTPHVPDFVLELYGYTIHTPSELNFKRRKVIRNGFEFHIMTCSSNTKLQEMQFQQIEESLIQAVGRARLVNNEDRIVHLFSNLPIKGAEMD